MSTMKICSRCQETKPLSEFHHNASRRDGHSCYCKACTAFFSKAYYAANRQKHLAACRKSKAARPEVYKSTTRIYRAKHKEKRRADKLWDLYNLTQSDYDAMVERQGNACIICGEIPGENDKRLSVDHDHETGKIRGLLCNACNRAIGLFKDNPGLCREAALYLEK